MRVDGATATRPMPIAIIGIGCRFPGGVVDADSFWKLLADGVDAITPIPADRFNIAAYYDEQPATPGKVMSRWGGFIDQRFDEFDADFFGISRTYAERLDPQQRLSLETAWEALEDAGQDVNALHGSRTGVFIGQWLSDFEHRLFADHRGIDFAMTLGSGRYAVPGRISYALGFRGPSLSLDAGCSAGLSAIHLAVQSLRSGESTLALAGGVNVILQPHIHVAYSQSRMMAQDGRCKFGDARADGYVRAEGAGMLVLKPLDRALADGDRMYAVIRGSAVNNDGDSSGSMGTPSRVGQEELIRAAFRDADVAPARVAYVEAHGTGTRAGDPVELGVLASVLAEGRPVGSTAWVGSVKTNIGHTESTAGVAGLIKGALMLHRGMIPPSLHFTEPNPEIDWNAVPVRIPTQLMPWPATQSTQVLGVSSFGIGGTNAHVVLESAPSAEHSRAERPARGASVEASPSGASLLLPLSARSDAALRELASRYAELLSVPDASSAADVCRSAATRRSALSHRAAFVARDRETLVSALRTFASGEPATADGIVHDRVPRRVAFVVPGQGAQWTGMARQFMAENAVFRAAVEECDTAARAYVSWSIVEQLQLDASDSRYLGDRIDVIQPTLIAIAIAYAAWLRSVGIEPAAVVGHSLGEVGAAAIAGVLSLPDAMRVICHRSALMQRTSGRGAMAVIELSDAEVHARLAGYESEVSIAVNNSPRSTVISGAPAAVQAILADLERDGAFCRLVKVDVASHSPQMEPLVPELVALLSDVRPAAGSVPMYSTVNGCVTDGTEFTAAYWGRNLRQRVQFGHTVSEVTADGITAFVELGPHPVLTQAIAQIAAATGAETMAVACGRREESDVPTAFAAIAALWSAGVAIDWARVMPCGASMVALPLYPWQRERYWADAADLAVGEVAAHRRRKLDGDLQRALHTLVWEAQPLTGDVSATAPKRWVVVGASDSDAQALAVALRASGATATLAETMDEAGRIASSAADRSACGIVVLPGDDSSIAFSPVAGLMALHEAMRGAPHAAARVWWITTGAHAVAGAAPSLECALRAAMWGAARVLGEEYPEWFGGLIDLDPAQQLSAQAELLGRHLRTADGETQVALRAGVRYALRLAHAPTSSATPFIWKSDAAYLITGGFGGVSLQLAHAMVRDGARRLVLLGRTALPPRAEWAALDVVSPAGARAAAVRALEHAGASVHVLQADISDERSVRAALEAYRAEGWPPIDGVIHNAAVLDNRLAQDLTEAQFASVLAPKLVGAVILDRLLPELSLFAVSSSISAFWAPAGMANYAAANAGVDALAAARRARGQHAVSIQWCPWDDVGLHGVENMARNVAELERVGVHSISGDQGAALFNTIISRADTVVSVLPMDWAAYRAAFRGRIQPLFRAIPETATTPDDEIGRESVLESLHGASTVERRQLEALVRTVVASVLRRPATQLDGRQKFGSIGVDSLLALEIRTRLETALERPLTATLAWNYPTIESLSAHLDGLLFPPEPVTQAQEVAPAFTVPTASDFSDVIALSDDDALRALRRRR